MDVVDIYIFNKDKQKSKTGARRPQSEKKKESWALDVTSR